MPIHIFSRATQKYFSGYTPGKYVFYFVRIMLYIIVLVLCAVVHRMCARNTCYLFWLICFFSTWPLVRKVPESWELNQGLTYFMCCLFVCRRIKNTHTNSYTHKHTLFTCDLRHTHTQSYYCLTMDFCILSDVFAEALPASVLHQTAQHKDGYNKTNQLNARVRKGQHFTSPLPFNTDYPPAPPIAPSNPLHRSNLYLKGST